MYAHWFRIIGNKREIKTDRDKSLHISGYSTVMNCSFPSLSHCRVSLSLPKPEDFQSLKMEQNSFPFSYRSNALEISIRNWIVTYAACIDSSKPTSFPRERRVGERTWDRGWVETAKKRIAYGNDFDLYKTKQSFQEGLESSPWKNDIWTCLIL